MLHAYPTQKEEEEDKSEKSQAGNKEILLLQELLPPKGGENLLLILTGKGGKLVSSKAKEEISGHLCTRKTTLIGICVYEFRKNYFFLFSLREYHACDLSAFYFPSFSSQIK